MTLLSGGFEHAGSGDYEGSGFGVSFDDEERFPLYPDLRGPPGRPGQKGLLILWF